MTEIMSLMTGNSTDISEWCRTCGEEYIANMNQTLDNLSMNIWRMLICMIVMSMMVYFLGNLMQHYLAKHNPDLMEKQSRIRICLLLINAGSLVMIVISLYILLVRFYVVG